jgi:hypothetical protein
MTVQAVTTAMVATLLIGAVSRPIAAAEPRITRTPSYANLTGRVVLDNERVLVQVFSIQPTLAVVGRFAYGERAQMIVERRRRQCSYNTRRLEDGPAKEG